MISFFENKTDAVQFANDINETFGPGSASITTTKPGKYAVAYAPHVTDLSLEDTAQVLEASSFFSTQAST